MNETAPLPRMRVYDACAEYLIDAYGDTSNRWNGWANPYLTRAAVTALVNAWSAQGMAHRWDGDVLTVQTDPDRALDDEGGSDVCGPVTMLTVDGPLALWPLGYMGWCWSDAADYPDADDPQLIATIDYAGAVTPAAQCAVCGGAHGVALDHPEG